MLLIRNDSAALASQLLGGIKIKGYAKLDKISLVILFHPGLFRAVLHYHRSLSDYACSLYRNDVFPHAAPLIYFVIAASVLKSTERSYDPTGLNMHNTRNGQVKAVSMKS